MKQKKFELPRGLVAVETTKGVEIWFTNEVMPPEWVTLGMVEIESPVHYLESRTWDQVTRWRYHPRYNG